MSGLSSEKFKISFKSTWWWFFKVSEFELSWENEFCKMKWLTLKMNHRLLRCLLTVFVIIFGTTVQYRSNAIATNVNITTDILKNTTEYNMSKCRLRLVNSSNQSDHVENSPELVSWQRKLPKTHLKACFSCRWKGRNMSIRVSTNASWNVNSVPLFFRIVLSLKFLLQRPWIFIENDRDGDFNENYFIINSV